MSWAWPPSRFEFVQPSLEDVFMDVVAREEAAAV